MSQVAILRVQSRLHQGGLKPEKLISGCMKKLSSSSFLVEIWMKERLTNFSLFFMFSLETSETIVIPLTTSQDKNDCLSNSWFHHEQDLKSNCKEVIFVKGKGRKGLDIWNTEKGVLNRDIYLVP